MPSFSSEALDRQLDIDADVAEPLAAVDRGDGSEPLIGIYRDVIDLVERKMASEGPLIDLIPLYTSRGQL